MKMKNFSLIKFSKTTDLSFLASAQIPTFCRKSTKINQERTRGKGMPTLHLAYIKSSAGLLRLALFHYSCEQNIINPISEMLV